MKDLDESQKGILYAITTYTIWGFIPIYFKYLAFLPALEMLSHRIVWSVLCICIIITIAGGWKQVRETIKDKKIFIYLFASTLLIATNWLVYIWAIANEHMLDASLGYFINPLVSVLLGMVFMGESLSRIKWIAVALAFIGVLIQVISLGALPWVSIALPLSFAFYALVRKKVAVDTLTGLLIETLLLVPMALYYLLFIADSSASNMFNNDMTLNIALIAAGAITAIPLLFFGAAATRVKLSLLGFFQYIAPSMLFMFAVVFYDEPLTQNNIITFGFIWAGLLLFVFEKLISRAMNGKAKPIEDVACK